MNIDMKLLTYAELYSHEYQRAGLTIADLRIDMVTEAIIMPHIDTLSRFIAMQQAVHFVDIIIKPVWERIQIETAIKRIRHDTARALGFVTKMKDN